MATVHYRRLPASLSVDREFVSDAQYALLIDLEPNLPAGFNVNEGHRTMERQAELVRLQGLYSAANPHGAAAPSATAPHIKTGHADHALDCIRPDALVAEAHHQGVDYRYTVPTEDWHIEPDGEDLARFAVAERGRRAKAVRVAKIRVRRAKRVVVRSTGKLKRERRRLSRAQAQRKAAA